MIPWLLRNWKVFLAAGLMLGPIIAVAIFKHKTEVLTVQLQAAVHQSKSDAETIARTSAEKKLLLDNQQAWVDVRKQIDQLARETSTARAVEVQKLNAIQNATIIAKEAIKHEPQADQPFVFSDAAYSLVRQ